MTSKLQNALNEQITAELWSANLYLSMSFYMKKRSFQDGVEAVDLRHLAVRLDRAADLQRRQQLHAVCVLVPGNGEGNRCHTVFRVAWITQNCAHHDRCPPFSR